MGSVAPHIMPGHDSVAPHIMPGLEQSQELEHSCNTGGHKGSATRHTGHAQQVDKKRHGSMLVIVSRTGMPFSHTGRAIFEHGRGRFHARDMDPTGDGFAHGTLYD